MLDSLFILIFIVAFVTTVLAYENKSIIYSMLSIILWVIIMAQSLWITDVARNSYTEYGVSAVCIAFIFVNIIMLIVYFMDWKHQVEMP